MSIKKAILEKNGGAEIEFGEYTNLVLDDMPLDCISEEDQTFLAQFTACQTLSLINCGLTSITRLPLIEALTRLELSDNKLGSLAGVAFPPHLATLKLANNQLADWAESLGVLKQAGELKSLDLSSNKFEAPYAEALWKEIASLEVLDGKDRQGKEIDSEDEFSDDEDDGEEGESDMSDEDEEAGESDLSEADEVSAAEGESVTAAEETAEKKAVSSKTVEPEEANAEKRQKTA